MPARCRPMTNRPLKPAAALVVKLGNPINSMWRQLASEERREFESRLVPIQVVDFYPPYFGFGSER
jgi:hypothetical protein